MIFRPNIATATRHRRSRERVLASGQVILGLRSKPEEERHRRGLRRRLRSGTDACCWLGKPWGSVRATSHSHLFTFLPPGAGLPHRARPVFADIDATTAPDPMQVKTDHAANPRSSPCTFAVDSAPTWATLARCERTTSRS